MIILNDNNTPKVEDSTETLNTTPTTSNNSNLMSTILGFTIGITHTIMSAFIIIAVKKSANINIELDVQIYFLGLSNTVLGFIFMLIVGGFYKLLDIYFLFLCFINSISFYIAVKLQQISLINLDVIQVTTITYLLTFQAFLLGAFFLHDIVGVTDIFGSLLILGFNVYNAMYPD